MAGWIITAIIAVPFVVMAIFLLKGKGAFLIAGYNTMNDEKRKTYDEKALCKAAGKLLLIITVLMLLFPLAMELEAMWLFWVAFILVFVVIFGFMIYANTGNRFRKAIDPGDEQAAGESNAKMSNGKKLILFVGIVITVLVLISVCVMFYYGDADPVVTVNSDHIQISAMYGLNVNFSEITNILLVDKSMTQLGIGTRTNGYAGFGQALKGNFNSVERGRQLLFVYSSSSPTIQISRTSGVDIFISFSDSTKTLQTYNKLAAAFSD